MDESRIGQYSISVTTYPIMALLLLIFSKMFFCQIAGDNWNCYRAKTRQKGQNNETIYQGTFYIWKKHYTAWTPKNSWKLITNFWINENYIKKKLLWL